MSLKLTLLVSRSVSKGGGKVGRESDGFQRDGKALFSATMKPVPMIDKQIKGFHLERNNGELPLKLSMGPFVSSLKEVGERLVPQAPGWDH